MPRETYGRNQFLKLLRSLLIEIAFEFLRLSQLQYHRLDICNFQWRKQSSLKLRSTIQSCIIYSNSLQYREYDIKREREKRNKFPTDRLYIINVNVYDRKLLLARI